MKSESVDKLAEALAKAQGQIEGAELNQSNPFFKSKYADLGSIISAAKKPLAANGLSVVQLVSNTDTAVAIETMLLHSSGQWISEKLAFPFGDEKGRSIAQTIAALTTYGRRIGYSAIVGVYADEDSDGEPNRTAQSQYKTTQNGRQSWAASAALLTRIADNIGYFGGQRPHIINALQKLGQEGKITLAMSDDEVFAIVDARAKQIADTESQKK